MSTFLVWAAMALSPLAGGQTASCGLCDACECCSCCESGACTCSECRCSCCEAGASKAEGCCTVSAGADREPQAEQAGWPWQRLLQVRRAADTSGNSQPG